MTIERSHQGGKRQLIRLMGRQCLAPEAEPVSVAGSIPVALTSVILVPS